MGGGVFAIACAAGPGEADADDDDGGVLGVRFPAGLARFCAAFEAAAICRSDCDNVRLWLLWLFDDSMGDAGVLRTRGDFLSLELPMLLTLSRND
jgi:hypothetical protein